MSDYMEPMTEEAKVEYAQFIFSQRSNETGLTQEGYDFASLEGKTPLEQDQTRILELIKELSNDEDIQTSAGEESVCEQEEPREG